MSEELKGQLKKRGLSLLWRAGMLSVALLVGELVEVLDLFNLPDLARVSLGLVLGEVSKFLNKKTQELQK